jgi:hypothetical protein
VTTKSGLDHSAIERQWNLIARVPTSWVSIFSKELSNQRHGFALLLFSGELSIRCCINCMYKQLIINRVLIW